MRLLHWSSLARMPPKESKCNCKHHRHQRELAQQKQHEQEFRAGDFRALADTDSQPPLSDPLLGIFLWK
ncbi:hypothetical protein Hamer_G024808 [Homarus americanus]|uniref:Uncharacterized protein n=1 Tax=Homarus americanus TaxID=6706 RepID=A0A8J5K7S5_HOMAM|nr:hypothetical protein Hamer_G024808 [Homarus americanus]